MSTLVKYNFGSPLGTGKQWMSWIHMDDLVGIFYESIVNTKIEGVFNGIAPETVRNSDFTQTLANILSKKIWLPAVPSFLLKLILGEMSVVILGSSKVKNKRKILPSFQFPTLEKALSDIFNTK